MCSISAYEQLRGAENRERVTAVRQVAWGVEQRRVAAELEHVQLLRYARERRLSFSAWTRGEQAAPSVGAFSLFSSNLSTWRSK